MGRTARQGQEGSYSLVLCQKHLERLGFDPDGIKATAGRYSPDLLHLIPTLVQTLTLAAGPKSEP